MEKLKLFARGNEKDRNFFIIEKNQTFFSLFPKFLLNCGFRNNIYLDEYQDNAPRIDDFIDMQENFKNENYDIDLIYGKDKIILIIRTSVNLRDKLTEGIQSICSSR